MERPRTAEEAMAIDSAARLDSANKRTRVECHLCGQVYNAAQGHLGSDYCLINTRLRVHHRNGFEVVDSGLRYLARDAHVPIVLDWVGSDYSYKAFRQTRAARRLLVPCWFAILARKTKRMNRRRRLALLLAVQAPAMAEALALIAWRRDTAWLLDAFSRVRARRGDQTPPIGSRLLAAWLQYKPRAWPSQDERILAQVLMRKCQAWGNGCAMAYIRQAPEPERRQL